MLGFPLCVERHSQEAASSDCSLLFLELPCGTVLAKERRQLEVTPGRLRLWQSRAEPGGLLGAKQKSDWSARLAVSQPRWVSARPPVPSQCPAATVSWVLFTRGFLTNPHPSVCHLPSRAECVPPAPVLALRSCAAQRPQPSQSSYRHQRDSCPGDAQRLRLAQKWSESDFPLRSPAACAGLGLLASSSRRRDSERLLDVPRFARTLCPLAFGSHRTSAERGAGAPRTYPCLPPPARWAQVRFPDDSKRVGQEGDKRGSDSLLSGCLEYKSQRCAPGRPAAPPDWRAAQGYVAGARLPSSRAPRPAEDPGQQRTGDNRADGVFDPFFVRNLLERGSGPQYYQPAPHKWDDGGQRKGRCEELGASAGRQPAAELMCPPRVPDRAEELTRVRSWPGAPGIRQGGGKIAENWAQEEPAAPVLRTPPPAPTAQPPKHSRPAEGTGPDGPLWLPFESAGRRPRDWACGWVLGNSRSRAWPFAPAVSPVPLRPRLGGYPIVVAGRPGGALAYDTWCGVAHGCTRKLGLKICAPLILPGALAVLTHALGLRDAKAA
ncbi:hypothetical protein J1605_005260 [Eschrichtius robustus]|uniref:Uncharacterized protein n=1 Tax=Eschrichtius robustus TaxID=9764 RepID=A0AB34HA75_ESCRO|nr:hypothetical protein J1605_005260 [Eschrichtius robustus]